MLPTTELPEMGEYQGKPIRISDALAKLSQDELADLVVEVPGQGRVRPWRFVQPADDVTVRAGVITIG